MSYDYETVIITLKNLREKISCDLEIPANVVIGHIKTKILDVMKNLYPEKFINWSDCKLIYKNFFLNESDILSNTDVYDGSCVYIVRA